MATPSCHGAEPFCRPAVTYRWQSELYDERLLGQADAPDRANLATLQFFFTEELLQDVERSARASYNGRQNKLSLATYRQVVQRPARQEGDDDKFSDETRLLKSRNKPVRRLAAGTWTALEAPQCAARENEDPHV